MFLIFVFSTTKLVNILTSCKSAEGNERVRHLRHTLPHLLTVNSQLLVSVVKDTFFLHLISLLSISRYGRLQRRLQICRNELLAVSDINHLC